MKKFFSISISCMLLIILSITLNVAQAKAQEAAATEEVPLVNVYDPDKDVIVKVNDFEITFTNHQIAINNLMPRVAYHKSVSERRQQQINKQALDSLILDQLIYEDSLKNSMTVSKRDVKKAIRSFQNNLPSGMTLRKVLKQSNMTKADLAGVFERSMLVKENKELTREKLMAQAKELVTEDFMKEHYKKNLKSFKEPGKVHISEILLKADPGGGKKVWFKVRDRAKEVKARIDAGEDFAEVAKEVSEDPYAAQGGDMGWAHSGTLMIGLEEATANLKDGEVIGPVESLYGYHIIKLHERAGSQLKPFEELNLEKLKSDLNKSEFKILWNEWVKSLKDNAVIVYLDEKK